ncbi:hypothetical protein ACH42_09685 [Endozoicomonas sp. (ex Bugula neritina AB1)]|nr:hypothetical protein ACH42_09685 [Endozoicomonas sp. (ex Bugula neritina AB1)]
MKKIFILAWFFAFTVTFVLGSVLHSQFVLADLVAIGVSIPQSVRVSAVIDDLIGLLPGYGAVIALGLLLAFLLSGWLQQKLQTGSWLHVLSGFSAMLAIHALMYPLMEITLIASVRSFYGLLAQCIAGAVGGALFAVIVVRGRSKEKW